MEDYDYLNTDPFTPGLHEWGIFCPNCETILFITEKLENGEILFAKNITHKHPKIKEIVDGEKIICPECKKTYILSKPIKDYQNPIEKLIKVLGE